MRLALWTTVIFMSLSQALKAHEFWIAPEQFQTEPQTAVIIHLREGQKFAGKDISYHSRRFHQFELLSPNSLTPIKSKNDTVPAAKVIFEETGLNILIYQSKLSLVTYDNMDKFESFLKGKHLDWGIEAHKRLGLPGEAIREAYFRYAKALVQVGNADAGADRLIGMPLELVALDNPYKGQAQWRAQLFYKNEAYADQWVFVFRRDADGVEKSWYKTDAQGIATIPINDGGEFQINAVHLQEASERMNEVFGAHWQTLWASMTFDVTPQ